MRTPSFFAFGSAHGGVGRTLAVWGVGRVLAAQGLRVLLVDLDLESPGLTRLVEAQGEGIVEAGADAVWLTIAEGLRVLPAGRLDAAYWDRLDAWTASEQAAAWGELRRSIAAVDDVDMVLVDVGAGSSRATERALRALAERVVLFTALNRQHVAGTAELVRRCEAAGLATRVVGSLLPLGEDELTAAREAAAREAGIELSLAFGQHPRVSLDERASERGPVLAGHVELARLVLREAGFEVGTILRAMAAAIAEGAWSRVLSLVRVAKVVEPEGASLTSTLGWLREHATPDAASDPVFAALVQALPADSPVHASFATALHRAGNALARGFYEQFLKEVPDHADMLGNFAALLSDVCGEHDLAEDYYQRALAADDEDADHRGNFANFLALVRGDRARADACYRETIARAPEDAHHLGNYANFRISAFADSAGAEALYRRALAVEPDDANLLGNFARLLLAEGRAEDGRALLGRALAGSEAGSALRCELCFYALAHAPELCPDAMTQLLAMLEDGVRSPGWDLRANVARARSDGHPRPELLEALAAVIADEAPLAALDVFQLG
ncbi:tetratricopeptide repeat protein [Nannocystis bainbridge]|uniref:Cellulose synthase operon protein YhjQ/BcsQ n=1 Tax=Nannocystis bainbridge TaxID=2995303 RepID=A0ABT5E3D4_9BACT|nr:tetratricopeptide repeat protein [Nannocystis bainbridge]MDC0719236.1 cellulose synthase operon protein YhjQ/BcsQ [Nannocystis bainbridge]